MIPFASKKISVKIKNKTIRNRTYRLDRHITSFTTNEDIDIPCNSFQMTLVPNAFERDMEPFITMNLIEFWRKTLTIGDILTVGIEVEDSWIYRIDSITEIKSLGAGGIQKGLLITGRNLASLPVDDKIIFAPELSTNAKAKELLGDKRCEFLGIMRGLTEEGQSEFIAQNPLSSILWVMLNMPSTNADIKFIDFDEDGNPIQMIKSEKIGKYFTFDLKSYLVDQVYNWNLQQYSGSIWNYLMQCIDPMFYEVFVEDKYYNGSTRPCIVVRPKPFDRSSDYENYNDMAKVIAPNMTDFTFDVKPVEDVEGHTYDRISITLDVKKLKPVTYLWDSQVNTLENQASQAIANTYKTFIGDMPYHTLRAEEDFGGSLTQTHLNVVNYYTILSSKEVLALTDLYKYGYFFPLIDTRSVNKWGMREIRGVTNLYKNEDLIEEQKKNPDGSIVESAMKKYKLRETINLREKLFHWYRYNEIFYNGSKKCVGHDHYRKGDKIFCEGEITKSGEKGMFAYIKGVARTYQVGEQGATYECVLKLDRGENPIELNNFRYVCGYDLYDRDIENEIVEGNERVNPIIKVNMVETDILEHNSRESAGEFDLSSSVNYTEGESTQMSGDLSKGSLTPAAIKYVKQQVLKYATKSENTNTHRWHSKGYNDFKLTGNKVLRHIELAAKQYQINPNIIVAVIRKESVFSPYNVSTSGCSGIAQFCYRTGKKYFNGTLTLQGKSEIKDDSDARFDPEQSIYACAHYLNALGLLNNPRTAIENYNGSDTKVQYYIDVKNICKSMWKECPLP